MMKLIYGDRISKEGKIRLGCTAILFDNDQKILLTQRTDNKRWCLPGGGIDPGESVEECCIREMFEETGMHVKIKKLVSVSSNPHMLVEYPDNRIHSVALTFEVEAVGGKLRLSDETIDYGYFSLDELKNVDLIEPHRERISDALANQVQPFIK